jgi:hypothetical protein
MLHELPDLSRLLDSAPVKIELRRCNLITLVRLHDELRQSMLAGWTNWISKGRSSPMRLSNCERHPDQDLGQAGTRCDPRADRVAIGVMQ